MSWTPATGAIGLTTAYGWASFIAAVGQFALTEPSTFTHAVIVLDGWTAMEPWPSGARHIGLEEFDDVPITYIMPSFGGRERRAIIEAARSLDGTPYGIRDYQALALWRSGWRGKRVARTVTDTGRLLPAQFVAEAYRRAGVPLFTDRHVMDVTIGDLSSLLLRGLSYR